MKKFFICTDGIAKGPYRLEDLLSRGITEMDLIWSGDWGISKYAFEIDELRGYFRKNEANPIPVGNYATPSARSNSTIVKNTILFLLIFVLLALVTYYFSSVNA
jgi:hypothetical protein